MRVSEEDTRAFTLTQAIMRTALLQLLVVLAAPGSLAAQAALPAPSVATFAYDATLPLNARDSLRERIDGIEVRNLSFDSPKGGRVTGLLYLPGDGGAGLHPGVIVAHGAPGNSTGYGTMTTALAAARSGAVVISIDAPFARRHDDPLAFTPADSADMVQLMVDLRRSVDYLVARGDVDPARIGYIGTSFGGGTGALFAGVEPRLRAAVLRVGDGGLVSHFSEPCAADAAGADAVTGCRTYLPPLDEMPATERDRWVAAMLPVEAIRFVGQSRAALLLQNARQDQLVPPTHARRLAEAAPAGTPQEWYDSGHRLPNAALVSGLRFLHERLGLAAPDATLERWLETRTAAPPPA